MIKVKNENIRGYDNTRHRVDNLTDNGATNINYYFDTNKECYVITWNDDVCNDCGTDDVAWVNAKNPAVSYCNDCYNKEEEND